MKKYLLYYLLVFTAVTGFYFFLAYSQLAGKDFVYPLDDAYIHLALSRNFADYGIWSVKPYGFDSASSSIIYTLILSFLIKIFGDNVYYPMIVNITAGYISVYWVYRFFKDFYGKSELNLGLFLLLPFTGLYVMVIFGMEQTLHMMFMTMGIYYLKKNITSNFIKKDFIKLLTCIFFIGLVRFESMFFTVSISFLLILNRYFKQSIFILAAGFLPIVIFGLISEKMGGFFFPNSLMMKGNYPSGNLLSSVWMIIKNGILFNVSFYKLFVFPFICILIYLFWKYKNQGFKILIKKEMLVIIIVMMILFHSLFAVIRYRYENYLLISLFLILIPIVIEVLQSKKDYSKIYYKRMMHISFIGVICYCIYIVSFNHRVVKYSSKNIEEQQIEMSKFLAQFYKGQKVVANDIGAICYFSDIELFDIAGLGSTEVTRDFVKNKKYSKEIQDHNLYNFMTNYIKDKHYKIAVIYPNWYPEKIPYSWIKTASWTIEGALATARPKLMFYTFNKKDSEELQKNLKKFKLNKNIQQDLY